MRTGFFLGLFSLAIENITYYLIYNFNFIKYKCEYFKDWSLKQTKSCTHTWNQHHIAENRLHWASLGNRCAEWRVVSKYYNSLANCAHALFTCVSVCWSYECELMNEIVYIYCLVWHSVQMKRDGKRKDTRCNCTSARLWSNCEKVDWWRCVDEVWICMRSHDFI